jgi:hypothetical protein
VVPAARDEGIPEGLLARLIGPHDDPSASSPNGHPDRNSIKSIGIVGITN